VHYAIHPRGQGAGAGAFAEYSYGIMLLGSYILLKAISKPLDYLCKMKGRWRK